MGEASAVIVSKILRQWVDIGVPFDRHLHGSLVIPHSGKVLHIDHQIPRRSESVALKRICAVHGRDFDSGITGAAQRGGNIVSVVCVDHRN